MKLYIVAFCILVTGACHAGGIKKPYLVSAEAKGSYNAEDLKKVYRMLSGNIKNGYTTYRITYNTTNEDGTDEVASGALFVPDIKGALPLVNYDHGTLFPAQEKNAPSYLGNGFELSIGKLFSAAGYLVVMPDYIGYGSTRDEKHPYGAYPVIAGSVIDMLYAVKEFCDKKNITLSGKNFFCGWSEGAAVALATVKSLEENHKGEFTPAVSVLNAGPYYTSGFADYVLDAEKPLNYMRSYVWILQSYNRVYDINRPLTYYFKEPAATNLGEDKDADIPKDPKELFTPTFISNYKNGTDTTLRNVMLRNDLWNWAPADCILSW
jgi:pimeloyl-ACP methyl ester carboxylesterase